MILSDRTIREELASGRITIEPLGEGALQPSSVDLHCDRYFRVFRNHTSRVIDVKEDQTDLTELVEVAEGDAFILHPGEFALGSTSERVALPDDLVARLELLPDGAVGEDHRRDDTVTPRHRGRSSEAEHQLPKLRTRVRFSSPAPINTAGHKAWTPWNRLSRRSLRPRR